MTVGVVITDYLNVTTPLGSFPFMRDAVQPVLEEAGASARTAEILDVGNGGTVKIASMMRVGMLSLSGAALAHLRALNLYGELLAAIAQEAHKVTILHAARDKRADAPRHVQALYRSARQGKVSLSRKAINPRKDLEHIFKPSVTDGRDTGTVYLGPITARVRAAVYDKRNERLLAGHPDPGPLLRHELRTKNVGATLRDAFDPTALFYHYMAPELLKRPAGVADWSPHAAGYELPPMRVYSPAERIQRVLDNSPDVETLLELAAQCGPRGLELVVSALRSKYRRYQAGEAMLRGSPQGTEQPSRLDLAASALPPETLPAGVLADTLQ